MKRKRKIIIIALIAIVLAVAMCGVILKYFGSRNRKEYIVLSTAGGVPYMWDCKINDENIATIEHVYSKNMQPKIDGGEVQIRFLIKGIKEGNTRAICNYSNTVSKEVVENNVYEIIVDKDLNVNIINN